MATTTRYVYTCPPTPLRPTPSHPRPRFGKKEYSFEKKGGILRFVCCFWEGESWEWGGGMEEDMYVCMYAPLRSTILDPPVHHPIKYPSLLIPPPPLPSSPPPSSSSRSLPQPHSASPALPPRCPHTAPSHRAPSTGHRNRTVRRIALLPSDYSDCSPPPSPRLASFATRLASLLYLSCTRSQGR